MKTLAQYTKIFEKEVAKFGWSMWWAEREFKDEANKEIREIEKDTGSHINRFQYLTKEQIKFLYFSNKSTTESASIKRKLNNMIDMYDKIKQLPYRNRCI